MAKGHPPPAVTRRTRTVALPLELHDRLRIEALQQSLRHKRRITLQEVAELALRQYLHQATSMTIHE